MLVDKLRMPVAPEQKAEIIKPGDDSLQFHPVHKKNRKRNFRFPYMIQECVLQILCFISHLGVRPLLSVFVGHPS
jgi:hypothetical protein